jgi:serine O-acetyltransferase
MTLNILLADLQRQYVYNGKAQKKATVLSLLTGVFSPRFVPVILCRIAHALYQEKMTPLARLFSLLNFVVFGIEIALRCEIGPGLYFPHTVGTVIGATRIGCNAVIYHGVTLGAKELDIAYNPNQRPTVGDNVVIGSGAKLLGGIKIGNNVKVGANAVVLDSFPDNVVVAGIPATIVRKLETISA